MKKKILPIITLVIVLAAVLTVVFVPKDDKKSNEISNTDVKNAVETAANVNTNGDIEIKLDDLETDSVSILSYDIDGTEIGLLAIKDDAGNIYTAFNTCQVCNGSPRAYFEQKNGKLVCQNCGNRFDLSSVGASAYGCNPMTISNDYITKTDNGITISKEFLTENKGLFTNWKKS